MTRSLSVRPERVAWVLVGLVVSSFVAYVLYSFFGALVVGVFLYYATRPVYRWLNDRIDHPGVNAAITIAMVGIPMLSVMGYAAFVAIREVDVLLAATNLDELRQTLQPYLDLVSATDSQGIVGLIRSNLSQVRTVATAVFTWLMRLFVIVTVAYYLLRDDRKIARWFRRSFEDYPTFVEYAERVDDDLTTIYTGNLVTIGVTALIAIGVFYGLNLVVPPAATIRFPVLLGLLIGIATLVPAVGMKIVYVPYTAYLGWLAYSNDAVPLWFPVVFLLITVVVIDTIPDIFVRSYLSKGDINMGLMLLTYVLAAIAFGWYGVFFGPIILVAFRTFAQEVFPVLIDPDATLGK